jgi:Leucine-rich repeat (LRR) protein
MSTLLLQAQTSEPPMPRCSPFLSCPAHGRKPAKYLARLTHLHLNGKGLTGISIAPGTLAAVNTLYLYDNEITSLDGLGSLAQLRHLYMQNNLISSVNAGELAAMSRLKKLYLNNNCLASLAPLAPLVGLVELHANAQRLPPGQAFDIAPQVLETMRSLRVLALANNGLHTTEGLAACKSLETVDLAKNGLDSLAAVAPLLNASPLKELDLRGNQISDSRQHLDAIIVSCPTITTLNGRELTQSERPYLQQLMRLGKRRIEM